MGCIHYLQNPTKEGNLYNWLWNLELIEGRSIVLRQNGGAGAWITYGGAAKQGASFTKENG